MVVAASKHLLRDAVVDVDQLTQSAPVLDRFGVILVATPPPLETRSLHRDKRMNLHMLTKQTLTTKHTNRNTPNTNQH
jgi:hypothetical protein